MRLLVLTLAAALLSPLAAHAQIYAWHDANGTLVLSDRKLDSSAVTYRVPDAPGIRATTPLIAVTYRDQFEPIVQESARRHALRPGLVRAVIQVESGFNPRARSPRGAMGLMQLMPGTAREMGVVNAYDPADNIRGGTAYLRKLIDRDFGACRALSQASRLPQDHEPQRWNLGLAGCRQPCRIATSYHQRRWPS